MHIPVIQLQLSRVTLEEMFVLRDQKHSFLRRQNFRPLDIGANFLTNSFPIHASNLPTAFYTSHENSMTLVLMFLIDLSWIAFSSLCYLLQGNLS